MDNLQYLKYLLFFLQEKHQIQQFSAYTFEISRNIDHLSLEFSFHLEI